MITINNTATDKVTKTTCPYCGVGCGVRVDASNSKDIQVTGDVDHPANFGKLCSKGLALPATLNMQNRLLRPKVDNRPSDWSEATDIISTRMKQAMAEHGPDSVGFYVSGQLLTEDYYVVNKLVKGYLGTANIDTNSRLCMASSVAGHKRAFGSDTVPGQYEDLERADLIILTGSNLAWCHPILQQRISAAKLQNPALIVIVIDPRQTATAELADIHLPIKPDGDVALFMGLLSHLVHNNAINKRYVEAHTAGFADAVQLAQSLSICDIELATGLSALQLNRFYELFQHKEKVVTVYSQGVNQSRIGTDKVNSIINCHLATGRIGRAGMGPFSVTGQPNAMGGREVGGLSNVLAAHMELEQPTHQDIVQRFWNSPNIANQPGLKAVDLFEATRRGKIKFLWIMATNPVVSMPNANRVIEALEQCPFVVVSDVVQENDTLSYANVRLPAAAWGEKDGTVTNSERRISRQRAFRSLPGSAKPDWWAVCEVAKKLGYQDAFSYRGPADIFREHAALSGFENTGSRDFDISACENITNTEYESMQAFVWPKPAGSSDEISTRFFANGAFYTPNQLGRFIPIQLEQQPVKTKLLNNQSTGLVLNTGRIRDQWHTMTRTGLIPALSVHHYEPFVELNPDDAKRINIDAGDIVSVANTNESILVRAILSDKIEAGNVFVPMHWTNTYASNSRVNTLVYATLDPVSGQPALKMQNVSVEKYPVASHSFVVARDKSIVEAVIRKQTNAHLELPVYWSSAKCKTGWRYEIASQLDPMSSLRIWRSHLDHYGVQLVEFEDKNCEDYRIACYQNNELVAIVFVGATPVASARDWVAEQLTAGSEYALRHRIIAGVPGNGTPNVGPIVCSCFMVGANQIKQCMAQKACESVDDLGIALGAGTNCGSCRGELQSLLNAHIENESGEMSHAALTG